MRRSIALLFVLLACIQLVSGQLVHKVDAVGITVTDMDRAVEFFTEVLTFEKVSEIEVYGSPYEQLKGVFGIRYKKTRLRIGEDEIELTDYLTTGGRNIPDDTRSNDLWFQHLAIVVSDMDSAYARLRKFNVQHVSTAPQTLPKSIPAAAGVKAFYFRDQDGHNLELIYFPPGKGNPKWQRHSNKIFLGIDHTAISITDTGKSRKFYNDLLGLTYQGESYNRGSEQEHLNNVEQAHLHISGNRSDSGLGVEFLEYITPGPGRPYPSDERADDVIHYETIMLTTDAPALYEKLKRENVRLISQGIVHLQAPDYGYQRGFYARDPDGHVVGFFQK